VPISRTLNKNNMSQPTLTNSQNEHLGQVWLESGLGEHASVAAFGRLILDLMSLGSPPTLLTQASKAIDDEVVHAQLCFGMARRFTGRTLGPGQLDISGAIRKDEGPGAIISAAVEEGCVFETISARQAAHAITLTTDPVARQVLTRIAADESQHAELSWAFVEWALQHFPDQRALAAETFHRALEDPRLHSIEEAPTAFAEQEQFGVLLANSKTKVTAETIQNELRPRGEALFAVRPLTGP
jgi:hypothetical protein